LFLLSLFLGQIANYTPLQVGEVILWAALPQLMVMPLAAGLSKKVDNRILCGLGLGLFGMSCLMNSSMDANTGHDYLVWSQIVRALGQPFIMLTMTNFAMHGLEPSETASASSLFNMMRNLGGSTGIALLSTSLVNREHFHSARLGDAISLYAAPTQERLEQLTLFFISKGADPARASDQALLSIGSLVRREAFVMAYNDAFFVIGLVLLAGVGALVFADKVKADEDGGGGAH
jgi:DHA2 family multidrug resistance protein